MAALKRDAGARRLRSGIIQAQSEAVGRARQIVEDADHVRNLEQRMIVKS